MTPHSFSCGVIIQRRPRAFYQSIFCMIIIYRPKCRRNRDRDLPVTCGDVSSIETGFSSFQDRLVLPFPVWRTRRSSTRAIPACLHACRRIRWITFGMHSPTVHQPLPGCPQADSISVWVVVNNSPRILLERITPDVVSVVRIGRGRSGV